jgi:hypothetical protein
MRDYRDVTLTWTYAELELTAVVRVYHESEDASITDAWVTAAPRMRLNTDEIPGVDCEDLLYRATCEARRLWEEDRGEAIDRAIEADKERRAEAQS